MSTNYSGYLSNFSGTTGSSGEYTDILSKGISATAKYGVGGTDTYNARYFTMGNILVQCTDFFNVIDPSILNPGGGSGQHTIFFPKSFSGKPWCVVVTPTNTGNNSNFITVLTEDIASTSFKVYIPGGDNVGLTYIAIGSGPPGTPGPPI